MITCGVEITTGSVKYVVLNRKRRGMVAEGFGRVPLEDGADPVLALVRLRLEGKIPHRIRVASGMASSQLRSLTLPPMPRSDLRKVVENEIERELQGIEEEMASGYQALARERDGRHRVLLAFTPRRPLQALDAGLLHHGFKIEVLTTSSIALLSYGLAELRLGEEAEAIAVVHIGVDRMVLTVLEEGRIRLIRDLGIGLDVSLFGSMESTGTEGAAAVDLDPLESLTRGLGEVTQVAGQIRRTLDYDAQHSKARPVRRILLAGDVTRAAAMAPLLANEVKLPVELLDPSADLGLAPDTELGAEGASYALPFALAKLSSPLAFLHLGPSLRAEPPTPLLAIGVGAVLLGLLALTTQAGLGREAASLASAVGRLEMERTRLEAELGSADADAPLLLRSPELRSLLEHRIPLEPIRWCAEQVPDGEVFDELLLLRSGDGWVVELEAVLARPPLETRVRGLSELLRRIESDPRVRDLRAGAIDGNSHARGIPVRVRFLRKDPS